MIRLALASVLLVSAAVLPTYAAGPFDDLIRNTTSNTNTLVMIDVKGAFSSPLAKAENWSQKGDPNNRGGLGFVPRDAEAVVISAEVNFSSLTRDFQVGLVRVRNLPSMREIAAREGGTPDDIAGRVSVLSPRDAYFTSLPGSIFVTTFPADRQFTARYLRAAQAGKTGDLTPFLKQAVEKAATSTITIALDLEDVADRNLLRASLPASPSVAKIGNVDVALLAAFLSQIKGMTFTANINEGINASLAVEFAGDPTNFRRTLPDLVRELIEGQGIAISSFETWEPKFTDNTMTLSGTMTTLDLKRLLSLFAFPSLPGESDPMAKGEEPSVPMTKRYLAAVESILTEIRNTRDNANYDKTATWHERAAAQIEQLSRRNVDPIASTAAFEAAKRLRAIALSLRGVPIDLNALENQKYFFSSGGNSIGWWGWRPVFMNNPTSIQTNIPKIQAEMQQKIAADQQRRLQAWSEIDRIMIDATKKLSN